MFSQDHLLVIYDNQYYKDCLLKLTCWLLIIISIMRIGYIVHKNVKVVFDICLFILQKHTYSATGLQYLCVLVKW